MRKSTDKPPILNRSDVIQLRISTQSVEIKQVANQIVAAEQRFNALPVSAQVSALILIEELRAELPSLAKIC